MRQLRAIVAAGLGGGGGGGSATAAGGENPFEKWRTQAAKVYGEFSAKRFNRFSRGGGDWPALAFSTIRARAAADRERKGKGGGSAGGFGSRESFGRVKKGARKGPLGASALLAATGRTVSILHDQGMLMSAVRYGRPGNRVTRLPNGIQYGFDETPHPGGVTIGQLAAFHHFGRGHNPVRRILVQPDSVTSDLIRKQLELAVGRAIAISRSGGAK